MITDKFYATNRISERISETPEGFLICEDVAITREGDLIYAPFETPIQPGDGNTVISRTAEDINDPKTIASFEGKPVTLNHPNGFVTPDNWKDVAVGTVQNVRPSKLEDGTAVLIADLLITDSEAIKKVKSNDFREVSCGYDADYVSIAPGRGRQESIVGNHVALVSAGRCGPDCAILDHEKRKEPLNMKVIDRLKEEVENIVLGLGIEGLTKGDEKKDHQSITMDQIVARLDSIESKMESDQPQKDVDSDQAPMMSIEERLSKLEEVMAQLMAMSEKKPEVELEMDESVTQDSDTVARAEILAPGISKTKDVKLQSLKACYATPEGKEVINSLLAGKTLDAADHDMLFVAASEMLKNIRRSQLNAFMSLDALPKMSVGPMTPEKINAMNAARYGTQS